MGNYLFLYYRITYSFITDCYLFLDYLFLYNRLLPVLVLCFGVSQLTVYLCMVGYYLFVDSRLATDGDRAVVYSPAMTLKRHTCVKLAVHVNISDSGDLSELSGYITSLDQRYCK